MLIEINTGGRMRRNTIIFGADMGSSVQVDNKNKDILIFSEGATLGLDDTTLTTEAIYPINFTQPNKGFVLSLHYNANNSFLLFNATKIYQFKTKASEIKDYTLCFGNISKNFTINNMKNRISEGGDGGCCKLFSIDFNPIDTNNILGIHKHLMKKTLYKITSGLFIGL